MTVVDHPLRQIAELNLRIGAEMEAMPCWKADLLWDTYLTLEFGVRQILVGKNGPVAMGEFRALLDDAAWWVERDGKPILDCDDVVANLDRPGLDEVFTGKRLLRLDWRTQLSVIFSEGITLFFEPQEDENEHLLELRFANGDCVDLYAGGGIEIESMSQ